MLFQNIDGNKSNFDTLAIELKCYEFSIIALAETNEDSEIKDLYQLTNYRSFYQEKCNYNKKKGSGVALYIHNTPYADIFQPASRVTGNLELLFVQLKNGDTQITIGVHISTP